MNSGFISKSFWGIIVLLFILSSCTSKNASQDEKITWTTIENVSIPLPPPGHPRLFLRSQQAEEIAARLKNPVLQPIVVKLQERSLATLQLKIEWDAINYLASKNEKAGREIIDSTLVLLKRTELPDIGDPARVTGRMMVTGAIVYDWLYPLLTEEEKNEFIEELIRLAKTLECGYPPTKQGSVTGHSSESFVMRDMLSAGIAIYDEYPEMYQVAAVRFFRDHLPVRNWIYEGHAYHQGDSYGPLRYSWDTYPLMIFDRMGVDSIYNPQQQFVPYFYTYVTRPDGQRMRAGDTYLHSNHGAPPGKPWSQYSGTLYTASYYNDGILLDQFLRQGGCDGQAHGRTNQEEHIFQFLWWNTDLQRIPVSTLPLSKYFGPPFGWMVARTGWDENSVIAEMKINVYNFSNHQHLDAGAFQIYHHGPLATESGLYGGTSGSYGSPHCKNYYWRTIAHNSLLIYDPDEQFSERGDFGNDGGQRLPNNRYEPMNLEAMLDPEKRYKTGEVLANGFGPSQQEPEYTYLKGDITEAYSAKVKEVKRSFVFLNLKNDKIPAAFIVFDKIISANPGFKKFWLLHSIEEPLVDRNKVVITRTQNNENGKLVNTCLIPGADDMTITPVGGPGKEFLVFGTNYENEIRSRGENTYERAAWRVEISPKKPSPENYFLNVMQIMQNGTQEIEPGRIEGDKVTGTVIGDRIVLFSKTLGINESPVNFRADREGNFKILITDLKPGTWQVLKDDKVLIPSVTVKDDGILYFTGDKGEYKVIVTF
jgi:hypothetical protein